MINIRLRLFFLVFPFTTQVALYKLTLGISRMTRLKDILRTKLWTESSNDLYPTFLASAIDLGARLPLKPSDGEGQVSEFVFPFGFLRESNSCRTILSCND